MAKVASALHSSPPQDGIYYPEPRTEVYCVRLNLAQFLGVFVSNINKPFAVYDHIVSIENHSKLQNEHHL